MDNIGTRWHIYIGNGHTVWWETLAHEVIINIGNLVRKGTLQWATLVHEGYTDKANLCTRWAHSGNIDIGTRWAHSRHIDMGNFAHDRHN